MSISTNYKKIGSTIKETSITKPKGGLILNAIKANEKIAELENQLEKQSNINSDDNKEVTVKQAVESAGFKSKEQAVETVETAYNQNLITESEKNESLNIIKQSPLPNKRFANITYKFDYKAYGNKVDAKGELCRRYIKSGSDMSPEDYEAIKAQIDSSDLPNDITVKPTKKTLYGYEIIDRLEGPKPSPVQPHFFTKYGYYLLYDGGVCYYKDKPDKSYPVELIKLIDKLPTPNSTAMYSDDEELGKADENCCSRFRHMTKSEYDELVKQNLPIEKIELVYQKRFSQTNGFGGGICDNRLKKVFFNFTNSIPVF